MDFFEVGIYPFFEKDLFYLREGDEGFVRNSVFQNILREEFFEGCQNGPYVIIHIEIFYKRMEHDRQVFRCRVLLMLSFLCLGVEYMVDEVEKRRPRKRIAQRNVVWSYRFCRW